MKAFIAGVITLSLLITAVTVNGFLIVKKADALISEIRALPDSPGEADDTQLKKEWEGSRVWIALTVQRENVDDIDDTLAQLSLEIAEKNDIGYLASKTRLLCMIERLKITESFSLSRIF